MNVLMYILMQAMALVGVSDNANTPSHSLPNECIENANLEGTWIFTFKTSRKDRIYETLLTQSENIAVGKIKGSELKIYIEGNKVKFTNRRKTPIGEMIMNYKGVVTGNTMGGTYVMEKGPGAGSENEWSAVRKE